MKRSLARAFLVLSVVASVGVYYAYRLQLTRSQLNTDLLLAAKRTDTRRAITLLEAGADPDARLDRDGPKSFLEYMRRFIRGSGKGTARRNAPTPLLLSLETRSASPVSSLAVIPEENIALVRSLLERGADPDAVDVNGSTALITAVSYGFVDTAKLLLRAGANVNHVSDGTSPGTALGYAVLRGSKELTSLLMEHGADVNLVERSGTPPLGLAASYGRNAAVRMLILKGAKINVRDDYGNTPLIQASEAGSLDCVKLLLSVGADPNMVAKDGSTALSCARDGGHMKVARLLKVSGALR